MDSHPRSPRIGPGGWILPGAIATIAAAGDQQPVLSRQNGGNPHQPRGPGVGAAGTAAGLSLPLPVSRAAYIAAHASILKQARVAAPGSAILRVHPKAHRGAPCAASL